MPHGPDSYGGDLYGASNGLPPRDPRLQAPGPWDPGSWDPGPQNPGPQGPHPQSPDPRDPGPRDPRAQNPGWQNPGWQNLDPRGPGPREAGLAAGARPAGRRRLLSRRAALRVGLVSGTVAAAAGAVALLARHDAQGAGTGRQAPPGSREALAAREGGLEYDLSQGWLFGGRYVTGSEMPGYDERGFERVTLPHTVVPLSWSGWNPADWEHVWIYRKHLDNAALRDGRVLIDFEGVMADAQVVMNGVPLRTHLGGYLPFTVEATSELLDSGNLLAVIVDSRWTDVPPAALPEPPGSIDYLQPGGIYRNVRLRVVPHVYLSDVFARPRNVLSPDDRSVTVLATIDAGLVPQTPVKVTATLTDGARKLATASAVTTIAAPGTSSVKIELNRIPDVEYWSPEHPKLYTVTTTVSYGSPLADLGSTHSLTRRIGFREATFSVGGFRLNGSPYPVFGLNRHQLFPYLGMAAPGRLQRRDAEILRSELNCNMVRCSHYPQSPDFLDACDELGLMVWEEPPGWSHMGDARFRQLVLQNVHDMVVRDRNRPSVVVWGTRLDETSNFPELYTAARRLAYSLDGSRPTSGAVTFRSTKGWAEDIFSYDDYAVAPDGDPVLLPPIDGVPYFVSEAVGALNPTYRWTDRPSVLAHQALAHAMVHSAALSDPRYNGLLAWAGIDYYSGALNDKDWHMVRTPGVTDVFRVPKPGAAIYQTQASPRAGALIVPVFFWDFGPGTPHGPGPGSMIATNCEQLEIFIDGRHVATALPDAARLGGLPHPPAFADLTVTAARRAAPPELRIDGYVGGRLLASRLMSADTARDRLELTADHASIEADGSDATRVTFRATDAYGNHRPHVGGDVGLAIAGPGVLMGQNPFAFGEFGGVGGAFVRSLPGRAGDVEITAEHRALGRAKIKVTVTPPRFARYL